jgi:nicotinamide mononucleotide transporter
MLGKIKNYFKDWNTYEKIWLGLFTAIIIGLSIFWKDNLIGIIASLTGIWCVVLTAKGKISNYYFGIINVITYAIVAYGWEYYGEVMLNIAYFLPMQFVGIYIWIKNRKQNDKDGVYVKFLNNKQRIFWLILSIIGVVGYGFVLQGLGGSLPFTDSMSTILSIIAMILMAGLYMEQWILWIVVDVVTIVMWFVVMLQGGNDISILLMWIAYLVNAVYGLINWIKMYKNQVVRCV